MSTPDETQVIEDAPEEQAAPEELQAADEGMDEPELGGEAEAGPGPMGSDDDNDEAHGAVDTEGGGVEEVAVQQAGDEKPADKPAAAPEQTAFTHGSPSKPVSVPLTEHQMAERAVELAHLIDERETLVEKKKANAKALQVQIDRKDLEIAQLGARILDGHEERKQGDLFIGEVEAAKGLVEVAKAAGDVPVDESAPTPEESSTPQEAAGVDEVPTVDQDLAAVDAEAQALAKAGTFICAMCEERESNPDAATFHESEGVYLDAEARKICKEHWEQLQRAAEPIPGFDFDESEPPPAAISSAKAIDDVPEDEPEGLRDALKAGLKGRGKGKRKPEARA